MAKAAEKAAQAYSKTHLFVPALGSNLDGIADEFTKFKCNVALLEDCPTGAQIATIFIWDLNGLPVSLLRNDIALALKLAPQLHFVKEMLMNQPEHTMGIIVERRSCPPGQKLTRRGFHAEIYAAMEAKGIDCDTDLALNFKEVSRPTNSIVHVHAPALGNALSSSSSLASTSSLSSSLNTCLCQPLAVPCSNYHGCCYHHYRVVNGCIIWQATKISGGAGEVVVSWNQP